MLVTQIDDKHEFWVIYFCGESFLSGRAFQSTAICRYARDFAGWSKVTGRHPAP